MAGAPVTVFCKEIVDKILDDIRQGVPHKIAAEAAGTHVQTFQKWVNKGLAHMLEGVDSEYYQLVGALRTIQSEMIKHAMREITADFRGHKGHEWRMERSFWQWFSTKVSEIEVEERLQRLENKGVTEG